MQKTALSSVLATPAQKQPLQGRIQGGGGGGGGGGAKGAEAPSPS